MPIFEYKCLKCGHVMEILQKTTKNVRQACEQCGSSETEKLLSGFAVGRSRAVSAACDACPSGPGGRGGCGMV